MGSVDNLNEPGRELQGASENPAGLTLTFQLCETEQRTQLSCAKIPALQMEKIICVALSQLICVNFLCNNRKLMQETIIKNLRKREAC